LKPPCENGIDQMKDHAGPVAVADHLHRWQNPSERPLSLLFGLRADSLASARAAGRGLKRGEFYLVYQPIRNVTSGRWEGVEALLRWRHPIWGKLGPDSFICEIEESNLIGPLTDFFIRTALNECGGAGLPSSLHTSINIAPRHLERKEFADGIQSSIG
jgi:EAL domain-containing protein (putative c-di-GMP-specific phosphodiesterase class I)